MFSPQSPPTDIQIIFFCVPNRETRPQLPEESEEMNFPVRQHPDSGELPRTIYRHASKYSITQEATTSYLALPPL